MIQMQRAKQGSAERSIERELCGKETSGRDYC